ncbi:cytidine and deoxycytidylate deaminase [Fragilaria crotonensis]|nr:cytidine and deoxycytidylate deaminase [Fragilaria crotonensis]
MIRVIRVRTAAFLHPLPPTRLRHPHHYETRMRSRRFASSLSEQDEQYLALAVQHARKGIGHTFPNPAVGCVIVQSSQVVGAGFHPKAGLPHAEVFALLQAAGHLDDGVAAAEAVIDKSNPQLLEQVTQLTQQYITDAGPSKLVGGTFVDKENTATAYVTLEPCCHHGKTPPCAASLVLAGVTKVVVGFRDPNPRVDGGGYRVLQDAGIQVVEAVGASRDSCAALVQNFVQRITPRDATDYSTINGAKRRALRALGGRMKTDKSILVHLWPGPGIEEDLDVGIEDVVKDLPMNASWLEQVDASLWKYELILLRLNTAVSKKKGAKILGERIAETLNAHVAQVMGHTALLYRPSIPPVLDLVKLCKKTEDDQEE